LKPCGAEGREKKETTVVGRVSEGLLQIADESGYMGVGKGSIRCQKQLVFGRNIS
jgi:hypothetical protein